MLPNKYCGSPQTTTWTSCPMDYMIGVGFVTSRPPAALQLNCRGLQDKSKQKNMLCMRIDTINFDDLPDLYQFYYCTFLYTSYQYTIFRKGSVGPQLSGKLQVFIYCFEVVYVAEIELSVRQLQNVLIWLVSTRPANVISSAGVPSTGICA